MAEIVRMPKMSDTMTEGVIAEWHKKVGDTVETGELMAEVETDKATMEYESFNEGTVLYLGGSKGDAIPVNGVLAIVGEKGEDYKALLEDAKSASSNGGSEPEGDSKKEEAASAPAANIDTSSINAEIVRMPKMSDTMTEGVIAAWHKKVGDTVETGELMAEVETDKATMEYESFNDGVVLYLGAKEGEGVAVDGVMAIVGEKGADYETLLKAEKAKASSDSKEEEKKETPAASAAPAPSAAPAHTAAAEADDDDSHIKASPLAKKLAKEKGYKLAQISGSGPGGRIVKDDVENFTPSAAPAKAEGGKPAAAPIVLPTIVGEESSEEIKVSQMRKVVARRLGESKFTAPHFYVTMEIDMDRAVESRTAMNETSPVKISFNDMIVKACAIALRQHPMVNTEWHGDTMRQNKHIHIGVAVAVEEGLLVPVIKFADSKTLSHISAEVRELAGKAKNKKLQPAEMEGSTFSISNLGMFGVDEFTAIVNPPNSCILAVGGISQTPVVKNGEIVVGNRMKVTLSCDHRVVDGAVGAAFLQTVKSMLEEPMRMLI